MLHSIHRAILNFAVLTVLVYPAIVFAEVSDKEPSTALFWKISPAAAIICLVGARMKPWLGIIFLLPAVIWFANLLMV